MDSLGFGSSALHPSRSQVVGKGAFLQGCPSPCQPHQQSRRGRGRGALGWEKQGQGASVAPEAAHRLRSVPSQPAFLHVFPCLKSLGLCHPQTGAVPPPLLLSAGSGRARKGEEPSSCLLAKPRSLRLDADARRRTAGSGGSLGRGSRRG